MHRIPDPELVSQGEREDNRGRWFSKNNAGETKLISNLDEEPGEDWTREAPIEHEPYQKWDEDTNSWTIDVKRKKKTELVNELGTLRSEISSRDWKVTKASRLGKTVEEVYPGETEWYLLAIAKINELEAELETLEE
jgi:hypothetical protein